MVDIMRPHTHFDGVEVLKFGLMFLLWSIIFTAVIALTPHSWFGKFIASVR